MGAIAKEEYFKINKRPKDDSSDDEQARQRKIKNTKSSKKISTKIKENKSAKSPKSSPKPKAKPIKSRKVTEIALNDDYDAKEREEMIERRRDRRRAQRKADKEIEAQIHFENESKEIETTQSKKKKSKKMAGATKNLRLVIKC